jgi:hypothetical protein
MASERVVTDAGYNEYGETVFFRDLAANPKGARFPVQIAVHVPIETAQKVPVQLTVSPGYP